MATFAPPVRHGDFLYSSVLYADPGNGNHHTRAGTAELAALLRPEAPNLYSNFSKPPPAMPAKDPVWHWYAAQLIHYGLPVTKDKNVAKVRLLNALNQFKLEVPAWISKVESELKREWEGENKKMKKSASSGVPNAKAAKATQVAGSGTQMLPLSQGINVHVNVSMSAGMPMIHQSDLAQGSSIGQKGQRKRGNDDPVGNGPTPKKRPSAKKVANVARATPIPDLRSAMSPTPSQGMYTAVQTGTKSSAKTPRIKQEPTAARSSPMASRIKRESEPARVAVPKPRTKQTASKRAASSYGTEAEPTSSPYFSSLIKQESDLADVSAPRPRTKQTARKSAGGRAPTSSWLTERGPGDTIVVSGTYELLANNERAYMVIRRDAARDIWWSTISTGALSFTIKMDPGPTPTTLYQPFTVGWRMRNNDTGELRFGSGCTGEFRFIEGASGDLTGVLRKVPGFGDVEFYGGRMAGLPQVGDLQTEWDAFRRDAYGR
ncbi:uncharacterized protein N0V89_005516 [Didymosphaeria variabile]|uniref:Uncharacterized protein n=1 Tax=Didymosphaeria variabile TaxID=1932322 RepID=A0A9W8XLH1_9PLEO|nr:uncharacterized protein N0V89_005516 [Didymosphaeria variabile]KAJ4353786.1 hypothetical protein N0V89_005516 [Didymosphaeria variabile]